MRQYDPRSPVQPGSSNGILLAVAAALVALASGLAQQESLFPEPAARDDSPAPSLPAETEYGSRAKADLASLLNDEDYPDEAIRNEQQGTVEFRLVVSTKGRAASCTVVQSSGFTTLDDATCRIMKSRLRAQPARDHNGRALPDTITSRVKWVLPPD